MVHNEIEGVRFMKLKESAFANVSGVLGAVYFVGCFAVASITPGLYKSIAESWMHMLNFGGLWKNTPGDFGLGIISFTLVSWVMGWLFAWLYNKFIR